MTWERQQAYAFQNGKDEKAREEAQNFLKEKISPEIIARCTELKCGWNLIGLDLSEYSGLRIEFEKNEVKLELIITDKNWQNWTAFTSQDPYTIEAYFSGQGAAWKWNDSQPYDKSQGLLLFLCYYSDKPLKKDKKTIIKKIELIK